MLNKKGMQIISNLRKDGRMSLTKMSRDTHIPVSTIYENMKGFEDDIIKRYTCLVDFSKLGYNVRTNIMIKMDKKVRDSAADFLLKCSNVNSLYKINSGFDFMMECVFKDLKGMDEFMEDFEERFKVKSKEMFFIIDDIKKEAFGAEPDIIDLLGS